MKEEIGPDHAPPLPYTATSLLFLEGLLPAWNLSDLGVHLLHLREARFDTIRSIIVPAGVGILFHS
jgi:hypothetical protein